MKLVKWFIHFTVFCMLVTFYNPLNTLALSLPGHLIDIQWPTNNPTGYSDLSVDITVEKLVGTHGMYYAHTVYLTGTNTDNTEPNIMYGGIQNVGFNGTAWIGKMAIFSVWGAYSGMAEPGGWGTNFGGEGTGYSVRIPYEWQVGRTYQLSFRVIGQESSKNIYAAYLLDKTSGVETRIGRIPVSTNRGLMYSPVSFHEVYGFNNTSPQKCSDLTASKVRFSNARAAGEMLTPNVYYLNNYNECPGRNRYEASNSSVTNAFDEVPDNVNNPAEQPTPAPTSQPNTPITPTVASTTPPSDNTTQEPQKKDDVTSDSTSPVVDRVNSPKNKYGTLSIIFATIILFQLISILIALVFMIIHRHQ